MVQAEAFTADMAGFDVAQNEFAAAMDEVPAEAVSYLKPGDEYSLGGLAVHVNFVLEHYNNVLKAVGSSGFAECRPVDPDGLEEEAKAGARSQLSVEQLGAELSRMRALHQEVVTTATGLGWGWDRKAPVWYPGSAEPFPTSPTDVLGWLTGHYREHVPHVQELVAAWRAQTDPASAVGVVSRFNEAFGRGDVEGVMALMTEDCAFENTSPAPDGERHAGQDAVRRFWTHFFSTTERPRFETEEMFAAGDRVVVRWRFSWGQPGSEGSVRGVDVFKVRDGKVAEKLAYVKG